MGILLDTVRNIPFKTKEETMNEMLLLLEIALTFGAVAVCARVFGKEGLMAWTAVAMILANLTVVKAVPIFGLDASLGNVMFASTFLATDILVERYGSECAKKSVLMGVAATVAFIVCVNIGLLYVPSGIDMAQEPMAVLFGLNARSAVASILCCMLANLVDIWLFKKIREKLGGKWLGFRSSFAAIVCNCLENFAFWLVAFGGIVDMTEIVVLALTTSAIEAFVGLFNAPFIYLATGAKKSNADLAEAEAA